jgi:hypothetical protein
MARPLKSKEPLGAMNSIRFAISVDKALHDDAKARGITKSDILRAIVDAYYAPSVRVTQVLVAKPAKPAKPAKAKA